MVSRLEKNQDGSRRRGMPGNNAFSSRNTQAAQDALRRRQKEKRARIVKKHVRYKNTRKLIDQISKAPALIVAAELSRHDSDNDRESLMPGAKNANGKRQKPSGPSRVSSTTPNPLTERTANESPATTGTGDESSSKATNISAANDRGRESGDTKSETEKRKRKFEPFHKQKMQFEKMQKEREAKRQEREKEIAEREEMLRQSKKNRSKRVSLTLYILVRVTRVSESFNSLKPA